jgi:TRAP transporter 4TM/12TM fusion protein
MVNIQIDDEIDLENRSFRNINIQFKIILIITGLLFSMSQIYIALYNPIGSWTHKSLLLSFTGILVALTTKPNWNNKIIAFTSDILITVGLVTSSFYLAINQMKIVYRMGISPTINDIIFGAIIIVGILEITRRTIGIPMSLVCIGFLLYPVYGKYIPGIMGHSGYDFSRVISAIYSDLGVYGTPLSIAGSTVFYYILFGSFLIKFGGGQFFIDLANSVAGRTRGGPAKVAVLASALFGTISGSSIANVATTGAFTIPLMKKNGFKPYFAAAVEAVASTGGQIMPPIMGSTAFILSEFTGIPYSEVALRAAVPAALYFLAIFIMVDLEAIKTKIKALEEIYIPKFTNVIREGIVLSLPIFIITICLFVLRMGTTMSALWSIVATIVACLIKYPSRINFNNIRDALVSGALSSLGIISTCAAAGLIIGIVSFTGLGAKTTILIVGLAGNFKILILFLTMVIAIILGMGLPTAPAYIITAAVCAPILQQIGILKFPAHLFIFYSSLLAMITPPVALAAYTAAGIARANPAKVGFTAFKLGLTCLLVPYMFVYGPSLVLYGSFLSIVRSVITAIIGVYLLSSSVQGYFIIKRVNIFFRILLLICALLLIEAKLSTDFLGLGLGILISIIVLFEHLKIKKLKRYLRLIK